MHWHMGRFDLLLQLALACGSALQLPVAGSATSAITTGTGSAAAATGTATGTPAGAGTATATATDTSGGAGTSAIRGSLDGFVAGAPNRGHCDPCAQGGQTILTGWAVDPSLAGGGLPPVTVKFSIDGQPPTLTALADFPRPDLVKAGVAPNANHGFQFTLPAAEAQRLRQGGAHTITASVGNVRIASPCARFKCASAPRPADGFEYIQNAQVKLSRLQKRFSAPRKRMSSFFLLKWGDSADAMPLQSKPNTPF